MHNELNEDNKNQEQSSCQQNKFKEEYKKYRFYKNKVTDFSELIDLREPSNDKLNKWEISKIQLQDVTVYKFNNPEGSFLIKNAFDHQSQLDIAMTCLNQYVYKPYRNSLFIYENMNTGLTEVKKMYDKNKYIVNDFQKYSFNKKIRWANVGWHYDWELRQYLNTNTQITNLLKQLINKGIDLFKNRNLVEKINDYNPESTIINFYDKIDHMGGHLDDGEPDQEHPIFSYNMGLSCVFLIGQEDKNEKPKAIRLDSGDLFIMSGYSRHCYHGVPRIIEDSLDHHHFQQLINNNHPQSVLDLNNNLIHKYLRQDNTFENNYQHVLNYLKENRINLTFRQVFNN